MDIAKLGISVDSKPAERAAGDLNKLAAAAKSAEQAARGFEQSAAKATTATGQLAQQAQRATAMQQSLNQRLNVRDNFDTRGALEYGMALDDMRAKINPLYNVERQRARGLDEINVAMKMGAISEAEHGVAIQRVELASAAQTKAIKLNEQQILKTGKAALVSGFQMQNLAFQINDVATMAAMGADPLRILTSQAGQFYQVLAMTEGGPRAALKELGGKFLGLLTPMRLVAGAGVAIAATAVAAGISWRNTQREIELALVGTGSAAGMTADAINRISISAAQSGRATVGEAREMTLALTATGRVGEEIAQRAALLGPTLARVFGEDGPQAAERLAKALADPAKAIDSLNARLGIYDDTLATNIRRQQAQGQTLTAQRLLISGLEAATLRASQATDGWTDAYNKWRVGMSLLWNSMRQESARALGLSTIPLQEQLQAAERELDELTRMVNNTPNWLRWLRPEVGRELVRQSDLVHRLREELEKLNEEQVRAARVQLHGDFRNLARASLPDFDALSQIEDRAIALRKALQDLQRPEIALGIKPETLSALQRALGVEEARKDAFRTTIQLTRQEHDFEMRRISARSAAAQADIVYEETLQRLKRAGGMTGWEADEAARLARTRVLTQSTEDLKRAQEQRLLSGRQGVETSRLELDLVGRTTAEQDLQRGFLQNKQQLQQEAVRLGLGLNGFDRLHLAALDAETAKLVKNNQLARERQLILDLQFERQQMLRTQQDQEVYSRLRSAGMLDANGQIANAGGEGFAAQMRLNQALQQNIDLSRDFAKSFAQDMLQGKSAAEALTNSLQRVASKLLDLSIDRTFSALLGRSGVGGSITGGLFGGTLLPGILHGGGVVGDANVPRRPVASVVFAGARRYHKGGMPGLGAEEVPAILQKGEIVLPKGFGGGSRGARPPQVNNFTTNNHFSPGMTPSDRSFMQAQIDQASRETEARTIAKIRREHQTNSQFLSG